MNHTDPSNPDLNHSHLSPPAATPATNGSEDHHRAHSQSQLHSLPHSLPRALSHSPHPDVSDPAVGNNPASGASAGLDHDGNTLDDDDDGESSAGESESSSGWKLFIGQIPQHISEEDLKKLFEPFGSIQELVILREKRSPQHRGCAFLTFTSKESADQAIEGLHEKITLHHRPLVVRYAGMEHAPAKLFVGMLSRTTRDDEISNLFSKYGQVKEVYLMRDSNGNSKGCAFVKMATRESANAAIEELNDRYQDGGAPRKLVVRFANSKSRKATKTDGLPQPQQPTIGSSGNGGGGNHVNSLATQMSNLHLAAQPNVKANPNPLNNGSTMTANLPPNDRRKIRNSSSSTPFNGSPGAAAATAAAAAGISVDRYHQRPFQASMMNMHFTQQNVQQRQQQTQQQLQHNAVRPPQAHTHGRNGSNSHTQQQSTAAAYLSMAPMSPAHMAVQNHMGINQLMPAMSPTAASLSSAAAAASPHLGAISIPGTPTMAPSMPSPLYSGRVVYANQYATAGYGNPYDSYNPYAAVYDTSPYVGALNGPASPTFSPSTSLSYLSSPTANGQPTMRGPNGANLFVHNLPDQYGDAELHQLFAPFGTILSTKVFTDPYTGQSKNFGFVSFDNSQSAERAIGSLDQLLIEGKQLKVMLKKSYRKNKKGGRRDGFDGPESPAGDVLASPETTAVTSSAVTAVSAAANALGTPALHSLSGLASGPMHALQSPNIAMTPLTAPIGGPMVTSLNLLTLSGGRANSHSGHPSYAATLSQSSAGPTAATISGYLQQHAQ